jgi:hypothetical protein
MRQSIVRALVSISFVVACGCAASRPDAARVPDELALYEPVFTTPGGDPSGAVPIGNGELGASVWVEANGDLCFYVARTDAWSETNRLLKLGKVRVRLEPSPFVAGAPFEQRLKLADGTLEIRGGAAGAEAKLVIAVDSERPVVRIVGGSAKPVVVRATLEPWRKERHVLRGEELQSSWTMHGAPDSIEAWEAPDVVLAERDALAW